MQTVKKKKNLLRIQRLPVLMNSLNMNDSIRFLGHTGHPKDDTDENDKLNARRAHNALWDKTTKMSPSSNRLLITRYDCV